MSGRVDTPIQTAEGKRLLKLFNDVYLLRFNRRQKTHKTINEWTQWTLGNSESMSIDRQLGEISSNFEATYPFHPRVLDVFEKKWQGLGSSFGRTRGVLRMLSFWIRTAYLDAAEDNHKHSLIMLGHAPLHEVKFANTVYGQMGNADLSIPINSDVMSEIHMQGN